MSPLSHLQTFAVMTSLTLSVDWQTANMWFAFYHKSELAVMAVVMNDLTLIGWSCSKDVVLLFRFAKQCASATCLEKGHGRPIVLTISLPDKLFILRPRKTHRPTLVCSSCLLMNWRIFGFGKTVCWVHHNSVSQQICSQREEQEADDRFLFVFAFWSVLSCSLLQDESSFWLVN